MWSSLLLCSWFEIVTVQLLFRVALSGIFIQLCRLGNLYKEKNVVELSISLVRMKVYDVVLGDIEKHGSIIVYQNIVTITTKLSMTHYASSKNPTT